MNILGNELKMPDAWCSLSLVKGLSLAPPGLDRRKSVSMGWFPAMRFFI